MNDTLKNTQYIFVKILEEDKSFFTYLIEPNTLIALTAILLSIATFFYSVRFNRKTLNQTIKHNKLSVKPFLSHIHFLSSNQMEEYLHLQNNGLGSAIIKSLKYEYENFSYNNMYDLYKENFKEYSLQIQTQVGHNFIIGENTDFSIGTNQQISLYEYKIIENEIIDKNLITEVFKKIKIRIIYEDIYQEQSEYVKTIH